MQIFPCFCSFSTGSEMGHFPWEWDGIQRRKKKRLVENRPKGINYTTFTLCSFKKCFSANEGLIKLTQTIFFQLLTFGRGLVKECPFGFIILLQHAEHLVDMFATPEMSYGMNKLHLSNWPESFQTNLIRILCYEFSLSVSCSKNLLECEMCRQI